MKFVQKTYKSRCYFEVKEGIKGFVHTGRCLAGIGNTALAERTVWVTGAELTRVLLIGTYLEQKQEVSIKTLPVHTNTCPSYLCRSVVSRYTTLTVDPGCVAATADANSASSVLALDVQAERQIGHRLVKVAFICLAVAVTLWEERQNTIN